MKYSIFHVEGGIGKHVAATAVAQTILNNHPDRKLIVVCAYPDIFEGLKFVHRVFAHGNTKYFYQEYVQDKDSLIFHHEPYFTTDHIYKRKKLIENWCNLYGLEYGGEKPVLSFNPLHKDIAKNFWKRDKPTMLIHTNGGPMTTIAKPYSWTRDMPEKLAQELVDHYKKDYHIFQVTKVNSVKLKGAEHIYATQEKFMSNMELFSLLMNTDKRILIDSCLQHAAAALDLKSVVLWNGTSPNVFGYDLHENITTNVPYDCKLPHSYLFDFSFEGEELEYPYDEGVELYDINDIIQKLDNI